MLGIGGKTLQAVGDQFTQGTDVLVFGGQYAHGTGFLLPVATAVPQSGLGQGGAVIQLSQQSLLCIQSGMNAGHDGFFIKIGVGDGGKQIQSNQMIDVRRHLFAFAAQGGGHRADALAGVHQQILHSGHIGGLAAHAGKGTALAAGGFLALITKHFLFHGQISLWMGNEGNAGAFLVKKQPA